MHDIAKIGSLFPKQITVALKPTGGIIKAGTPINANGEATNGADAVGLLRHDYDTQIHNRGVVVVAGRVDAAAAQAHAGLTYTTATKGALPAISLTGIADIPDVTPHIATDTEVNEAFDILFAGHK